MSKLKEKKDIKMTIFIIVVGVSLMVAGIYGVVSSRIESRDYKNSTDIQKISAVIIDFSTSNSKDDSGDVKYTTYKFKVSYVIDGKTYKGKCEERVWWNSYEKKYTYDKLRKGDTMRIRTFFRQEWIWHSEKKSSVKSTDLTKISFAEKFTLRMLFPSLKMTLKHGTMTAENGVNRF